MTDDELLAQAAMLVPVYCDGFGAFRKLNGVFRCIGWDLIGGANLNLIVSLDGAHQGNRAARVALNEEEPPHTRHTWTGAKIAH